jgi:flagella synthesis protein FlgN
MNAKAMNQIQRMITQDLATSRQLLALLEQEKSSTQSRDYVAMAQLLKDKTPLLEQLKQNAAVRSKWLASLNRAANEENWSALLATLSNSELQTQWHEVKNTIEHCQKINNINGKLINRGVTSHSRLLQIMRGNNQQTDLYDAKGSKHSTYSSASVSHA